MRRIAASVAALLLAAFFGFVGWHKAFAPIADLQEYHSWTVWLPEWLGRLVGWSELALAAALAASAFVPRRHRVRYWVALLLIANQLAAAAVHAAHGESGALPQNAVLIALLGIVAYLSAGSLRRI